MKNIRAWSRSRLESPFLAGAGADLIWSEPESELSKKVAAPQHLFFELERYQKGDLHYNLREL